MNVVFVFNEYSLHNHILSSYLRARPKDQVSLLKIPLVVKGKSRLDTGKKILPELSPRFVAEKFFEFLVLGAITWTPKVRQTGENFLRLSRIAALHRLPFLQSGSVTSKESLAFIRAREPDVIVTLMHQIVKGELLKIPKKGIINIHPGLLPEFRGIQPYFWALSKGVARTGVSLHLIEDESVDTGGILCRASFLIPPAASVSLAYYLTARAAGAILPDTVNALLENRTQPSKQDTSSGDYYRWPDRAAFRKLWANHHALVRTSDIFSIVGGKYDSFAPDVIERFESNVIEAESD